MHFNFSSFVSRARGFSGVVLLSVLAACGGGGGGGGGGNNPPPQNPPAVSAAYEALDFASSRADLLKQLNDQGARGFNFYGPNGVGGPLFNFYAKDSTTTFVGEILDTPTTRAALLAQMNGQGARGFVYWGPLTAGTVYIKESDGATYTYRVVDEATTASAFQAQANAQGAEGFLYIGPDSLGDLYSKSSLGNAKYDYRLLAEPATNADRLSQTNTQGQEGYRFAGSNVFSGEPVSAFRDMYVKDTSQSSTFTWKTNDPAATKDGLVAQTNAEAAAGFVYWSSLSNAVGGDKKEFYFKPTACTGVLCRSTSPL